MVLSVSDGCKLLAYNLKRWHIRNMEKFDKWHDDNIFAMKRWHRNNMEKFKRCFGKKYKYDQ